MRTQQQQRLFFCFDSKGKEREGQGRLKTLGNYVRHLRVAWQKKMNPPHFFVPLCCCYMLPMSVGCQLSQRSPSFFGLPTTNEGERDIGPSLSIRSLCHTHSHTQHTHSSGIVLKSLHQCLERLHAFFCRSLVSVRKKSTLNRIES